jgi:hypothetical protein
MKRFFCLVVLVFFAASALSQTAVVTRNVNNRAGYNRLVPSQLLPQQ